MRIAVAGGGIAGLTASIALASRGFQVTVYERAAALEEVGAGIQLSPNAMAVLDRLGIMPALAGRLFEPEALVIREARNGVTLTRLPLGKTARARYGAPYCTLHRADLQAALFATARSHAAIDIRLQSELRDATSRDDGVAFRVGDEERMADLLVGADGLNSTIRTGFLRHSGPRPIGRTAWRATLPAAVAAGLAPLDVTGLWLGEGAHLVHYPVRAGEMLNVVAIAAGEGTAPPHLPFGPSAQRLLDAVENWTPWPLRMVDCKAPWTRGRVALLGDAAHAMPPSAAQGGAQAIEDGWVLASCLARTPERPQHALTRFEALRRPRVERVVAESQRNLVTYELRGLSATLRNTVLRSLPARLLVSRLDWLFGWRPE